MPIRREYVASLYRDLLGRPEGGWTEDEISGHVNNPGGEEGLRQFFLSSPEYTAQHGGTPTWQNDASGAVIPYSAPTSDVQSGGRMPTYGDQPAATAAPAAGIPPSMQTDQWSGAGTVAPGNSLGRLTGYDYAKLADPNVQTAKYQVGRIVDSYNLADPSSLDKIVNDLKHYYPNVRITDYNAARINLGNGGADVDIIKNWGAPNAEGAWQPQDGSGGGGSAGGGGSTRNIASNISQIYSQLGQQYGGPGSPGIYNGPVQQAGQDPLSQLITGGLSDLILNQGMTRDGQGVMSRLQSIIESGGYLPEGSDARARKFESARELMAKGERTALNDARASLANRGLLSEPGNASGAELSTIGRVQTRNAEEFARALRDIGIAEDDAANSRLTAALGLATGMATDQARTLLATLGAGSDRQNMLSQIALESLSQNMAWNQFLATFGLQRDQAMYAIQNGQIDQIMPYLAMFLQLAQSTQRGYV